MIGAAGSWRAWSKAVFLVTLCGLLAGPLAAQSPDRGFDGYYAVRDGRVVASVNAERLFVTASVAKLIVAAASYHHLGPEHRVRTEVRVVPLAGASDVPAKQLSSSENRGPALPTPEPGTVESVWLVGAGDPTWSQRYFREDPRRPLRQVARLLLEGGVTHITGDVVLDASRFPGRRVPVDWGWADATLGYGASPSAAAVDENVVDVLIAPGRAVGDPGRVQGDGAIEWRNATTTVDRSRHGKGSIEFRPDWGRGMIEVVGEYPISEPAFQVSVAAPAPEDRVVAELLRVLREEGLRVDGKSRVERVALSPRSRSLGFLESPPLSEIVTGMLTDSLNWHAEMLLRHLALEIAGEGRLDVGLEIERKFLTEVVGLAADAFALDDGSGLSPFNLMTPNAVVELLEWCWRQIWSAKFFLALPEPGSGTLKTWGSLPPLRAKTGTLRQTQSLAGVLNPQAPQPVFFAVFLNHRLEGGAPLRREISRLLWAWGRR